VFTDPLPSNIRPIIARVGSIGNVFTESLPSNGYIRHNINMYLTEIQWDIMNLVHLAKDSNKWRAPVNTLCSPS
jgi:hypothetical protein